MRWGATEPWYFGSNLLHDTSWEVAWSQGNAGNAGLGDRQTRELAKPSMTCKVPRDTC